MRSAGSVLQPAHTLGAMAFYPFVSRLPANTKIAAQLRQIGAWSLCKQDKFPSG